LLPSGIILWLASSKISFSVPPLIITEMSIIVVYKKFPLTIIFESERNLTYIAPSLLNLSIG